MLGHPTHKKKKTWPEGLTKDETLQRPPLTISGNQTTMGCVLAMFPLIFDLAEQNPNQLGGPFSHLSTMGPKRWRHTENTGFKIQFNPENRED